MFVDNNDFVGMLYLMKYFEFVYFFEDDYYFLNYSMFVENVVWNLNWVWMVGVNEYGVKDGKNFLNYEDNWVVDVDFGFVDVVNGDYMLKVDVVVFD